MHFNQLNYYQTPIFKENIKQVMSTSNISTGHNEVENKKTSFDEHEVIHQLQHFLPAQAPLKDFIHHNTLHAFQDIKFYDALRNASKIFGYSVTFPLEKYRTLFKERLIREDILDKVIFEKNESSRTTI